MKTVTICVKVMLSITLLLSDPNPSDPINMQAARVLRNNPEEYNRMVRTMVGRQSRGGQRQARNEEGVAGPDLGDEDAREGAEQEEVDLDEVEEGAAGRREADAEVNAVDGEEVVADLHERVDTIVTTNNQDVSFSQAASGRNTI